jgi:hypothetical protein
MEFSVLLGVGIRFTGGKAPYDYTTWQESRGEVEKWSRAGEQGSRGAGEQGSRGAGEQGSEIF